MAERKYTHGLELHQDEKATIISIGEMEIWDGADLSLIRDSLISLIRGEGCGSIGINLKYVRYIPSGFFGMLFDWFESGVEIRLYQPTDRVQGMIWFRQFYLHEGDGCYVLHDGSQCAPVLAGEEEQPSWEMDSRPGESVRCEPARAL